MTPETAIQKQILDYLSYAGWFVWKNNNVGIYKKSTGSYIPAQMKGIPDLTAIKDGRVLMVEVKTPKGKLSEHQVKFQERYEEAGGIYIVARGYEDIKDSLKD